MPGLVHEDGSRDLKYVEGAQVRGLLAAGALRGGPAASGPALEGHEIEPAVTPHHQVGIKDRFDARGTGGPGDLRERRAQVGGPPGLDIRRRPAKTSVR
ncbi:hypothetical protein [Streptomyces sp. NPDC050485]|uniref:hypothetical protein n=1 Tax=Streptomyces sp. NPDC050485 TaxID=3365617 RepID=UPI003789A2A3